MRTTEMLWEGIIGSDAELVGLVRSSGWGQNDAATHVLVCLKKCKSIVYKPHHI